MTDLAIIREAFGLALETAPHERAALLAGLAEDARAEVESLLSAHDSAGAFLSSFQECALGSGERIGPYLVMEKIGQGGMGVVYRARRDDGEFHREVAIKLVGSRLFGPEAERRFIAERHILALLDHPNIVRMIDGGVWQGHRYMVMELVAGVPVTEYCADGALPVEQRLKLFQAICGAIHYAHQHMVLHRDLKPQNILVTADGQVRVLDFGIARLQDDGSDPDASTTALNPFTFACASPEQLRGERLTLASDIYSLGLLLYELLAGRAPIRSPSYDDQIPAPSEVAAQRRDRRAIAGDLDNIVMKALRFAPSERYASVREFGADVANYLTGRPVQAVAPTLRYRLRRWAGRHPILLPVAAMAAMAMLALGASIVWQARVADRERQIAVAARRNADRETAKALSASQAAAEQQRMADAQRSKAEQQQHIAEAQRAIAAGRFDDVRQLAHRVLFDYQRSLASLNVATDLRSRMAADSLQYLDALAKDRITDEALQLEVASGYRQVAMVLGSSRFPNLGDPKGARRSLLKAQEILERLLQSKPDYLAARIELGSVLCDPSGLDGVRFRESARNCLEYVAKLQAEYPEQDQLRSSLGWAYIRMAELRESPFHGLKAIEYLTAFAERHPADEKGYVNVAVAHRLTASAFGDQRDFAAAIHHAELARRMDERAIAVGGQQVSRRMELGFDLDLLGVMHRQAGQKDQARQYHVQCVELRREGYRANPQDALAQELYLGALDSLATTLDVTGDSQAARAIYDEALTLIPKFPAVQKSLRWDGLASSIYAGQGLLRLRLDGRTGDVCRYLSLASRHFGNLQARAVPLDTTATYRRDQTADQLQGCAGADRL